MRRAYKHSRTVGRLKELRTRAARIMREEAESEEERSEVRRFLEELEEEAERRYEVIEEETAKIENSIELMTAIIMSLYKSIDYVKEKIMKILVNRYLQTLRYSNLSKETLAKAVFAIQWLDPAKAVYVPDVNKELLNAFKKSDRINQIVNWFAPRLPKSIFKYLAEVTDAVANKVANKPPGQRAEAFLKHVDYRYAAFFTPLSIRILTNVVSYYSEGSHRSLRVMVLGPIGSGKTTMTYYSIYVAVRTLGLEHEDALKLTSALIVNEPYMLIHIIEKVTENMRYIPALVADDIAAMFTKYFHFSKKAEREMITSTIETFKIIREYIALTAMLSDTESSIPKGFAESADMKIKCDEGDFINNAWSSYSIWSVRRREKTPPRTLGPTQARSLRSYETISELSAFASPPMYMPQESYNLLLARKMRMRAELAKRAKKSIMNKYMEELLKKEAGEEEEE